MEKLEKWRKKIGTKTFKGLGKREKKEYEENRLIREQDDLAILKSRQDELELERIRQDELLKKKMEATRIANEEEKKRIERFKKQEALEGAKGCFIGASITSVLLVLLLIADLHYIGQGITFVLAIALMFYSVRRFPASSALLLLIMFPLFIVTVVFSLLQVWYVIWILFILALTVWSLLTYRKYQ